jgi:hypothetical protein
VLIKSTIYKHFMSISDLTGNVIRQLPQTLKFR